ncbi:MAG: GntR family transcriptional regulator [Planctomycetes bacterium]|nr:GntR family transcriptional regulator [Planctomycetota bacterium]
MVKVAVKNRPQGRSIAYTELKNAIQYLEMMPGSVISESDLMERMGLGRTPIREALIRLSEEYLVNIYPQSGTYVAQISFPLASEVAYMRHLLDKDVCMKLCREKAQIRDILDEHLYFMQAAIKKNDVAEYIRQDNRLHGVIFNYADHEMIWNIISNSRAHYNRVLMLDLRRPGKMENSFQEHEKIIEYIESGNTRELSSILDIHHDQKMDEDFETDIRTQYPEYFQSSR